MSILTINDKALKVFQELKKIEGVESVNLWETKNNPSPSPVGDKVRFYIKLNDDLVNFGYELYIEPLNKYKIIKKGLKRASKSVIETINQIIKSN